ncbi:MAG: DUF3135 domain-containing protein [Ectothiorhodospiraceae bacterium]|nr:DUF3135 domain-containing protein [Ectothiorhodospiraceae bacterium]
MKPRPPDISDSADDFDFDRFARLAKEDPEAFERERAALLAAEMARAPAHLRPRLEGLQWKADVVRSRASNPMAACIKLSELMWERVAGPNGLLEAIQSLALAHEDHRQVVRQRADVVPFAARDPESRRRD